MNILNSILVGPLRLLILCVGVLFVHQIVTRQAIKTYNLDYILKRMVFYGSIVMLMVFLLIQLNMYDVFSLLAIFFIILGVQYLEIGSLRNPIHKIQKKRRYFLLGFFKLMERNLSVKKLIKKTLSVFYVRKLDFVFLMAFICALTLFVSRFVFLKNELYTLSSFMV